MSFKRKLFWGLILFAATVWGAANSAIITLAMPIGARQASMGETGTALAEGAFSTWWNPAGMAFGPVADEWSLSQKHPDKIHFGVLAGKERRGIMEGAEVWSAAGSELLQFRDSRWRNYWSVDLDVNSKVREVVARFLGSDDNMDEILPKIWAFNGISSGKDEEFLVELKIPWSMAFKDSITAVLYSTNTNKVWVGTTRGLKRFDGRAWKDYSHQIGNQPVTVMEAQGAKVWIGTPNGLFRFSAGAVKQVGAAVGEKLGSMHVTALAWSQERKELYMGLKNIGVARIAFPKRKGENRKWAIFNQQDGLMDLDIRDLTVDKYGHVWTAHRQGVGHFSLLKWEQIKFQRNEVFSVQADDDGAIWIGTRLGAWKHVPVYSTPKGRKAQEQKSQLAQKELGSWRHYHTGTGMKNNVVRKVLPQNESIWFITGSGIERYHRADNEVAMFYEALLPQFNIPDLYHLGAAATFPLHDWGTLGGFVNFVSFGSSTAPGSAGQAEQIVNSTEIVGALSYGTRITQRQGLGVNFKFLYSDLSSGVAGADDATTASYAIDVSWLMKDVFTPGLSFGAMVQNIGPQVFYVDKSNSEPIPLTLRLGTAYEALKKNDYRLVFAADYIRESIYEDKLGDAAPFYTSLWKSWLYPNGEDSDSDLGPGDRIYKAFQEGTASIGMEFTYSNFLSLRMGYMKDSPLNDEKGKREELNFGVGVKLSDVLQVDFGIIKDQSGNDARDGQQRLSMHFKF